MKESNLKRFVVDTGDLYLEMAIRHKHVPDTCLMNGKIVMSNVHRKLDPCAGCAGPREKCGGRAFMGVDRILSEKVQG